MKLPINNNLKTEYRVLQKTVESFIDNDKKKLVIFSIFDTDDYSDYNQWIINSPDITSAEPVIEGDCSFTIDYWRVNDKPVTSPVISNPTWKDIIVACNDLLQQGDECGVYLEGIVKTGEGKYKFQIGS